MEGGVENACDNLMPKNSDSGWGVSAGELEPCVSLRGQASEVEDCQVWLQQLLMYRTGK